ncbi:MAG: hypothetical protein A2252_02735 [Elusimicrobia bacterium RIFOXYA2_FULL_39_19]|nr:MAG: hypothetical protein A2252_02735 [Elusimicrobia bacterium RIFOXYA2_FULL_39_19]
MKHKSTIFIIFLSIVWFVSTIHTQEVLPESSFSITSDFGPRNVIDGTWFHQGIDFSAAAGDADYGTPITAIESGLVTDIGRLNNSSIYQIRITGIYGEWAYLHIFRNNVFKINNWELRLGVILKNPNAPYDSKSANIIILWSGTQAQKILALADYTGYLVFTGDSYILDINGNPIKTQGSVSLGEQIAPMGDSGTGDVHLHLGLNYPNDNPLQILQHQESDFKVKMLSPGACLSKSQIENPIPIKFRIDSTKGLDLDSVVVYLDEISPKGKIAEFCYGGKPGENDLKNSNNANGETINGVIYKISPYSTVPGYDDFIIKDYDFSKLSYGAHQIIVSVADVNNNNRNFIFYLNIGDTSIETERTVIGNYLNPKADSENYPCLQDDWGQVFNGTNFHSGFADSVSGLGTHVFSRIMQENMPIENFSKIVFDFVSAGGGAGYTIPKDNIYFDKINSGRKIDFVARFKDKNGGYLGSVFKTIYDDNDLPAPNMIVMDNDGNLVNTYEVQNINLKNRMMLNSITIEQLVQEAGIYNKNTIKYVTIELICDVINDSYKTLFNLDYYDNVWIALNIYGIPWDFGKYGTTQKIKTISCNKNGSAQKQPLIRGVIESTSGNIAKVYVCYKIISTQNIQSEKTTVSKMSVLNKCNTSYWEAATSADGLFDSASEEFYFELPAAIPAGDYLIEIKSINDDGEQNALYYSFGLSVGGSGENSRIPLNLNQVIVYPNPFKLIPESNFYNKDGLTFKNMTTDFKISIYDISGNRIFSDYISDCNGIYKWNLKSSLGSYIGSGVYIYIITNNAGEKKTGKFAVIR